MKIALLALLLVAGSASAWTFSVDNFLGRPLDATAPNNGDVYSFVSATGKWTPGAGGGAASDASTTVKGITKLSVAPSVAANPIAVGDNDTRMPIIPAAGVRGNIHAVNAAGTAQTTIDEGTATDQFLASGGTDLLPAMRAIVRTDIDELLNFTDLADIASVTGTGTVGVLATSPTLATPILTNPTVNNTGTTSTVWHGNATGGTAFSKVVAADAAVTGTSDTFVMKTNPVLTAPTINTTGTTNTVWHGSATGATAFDVVTPSDAAGNTSGSGNFVLATNAALTTPSVNNPTVNNTGTTTTVWHGNAIGGTSFSKVVAADAAVTGTSDTFVMQAQPNISGSLTVTGGSPSILSNAGTDLTLQGGTGAKVAVKDDQGLLIEDNSATAATVSVFLPGSSGSDATLTYSGAGAAALTIGTGERVKYAGQAGDPSTFDDGSESYDTTLKAFRVKTAAGPMTTTGTITSTIVDSGAIANNTSPANFDQIQVIPANTLTLGKTYRVTYTLRYDTTGSPTVQLRLLLKPAGSAVALVDTGTGNGLVTGAAGRILRFAVEFTVRSIGGSGTVVCGADYRSNTTNTAAYGSNGPVTIDTTVAESLILEWTWSALSISDTVKIQSMILEQIN